jgi:hypothetical protein
MQERDLNFVSNRTQILEILMRSKEQGKSVGILSHRLGDAAVVTGVDEIVFEDLKTLVILKPYDHTGYLLPSYRLELQDITSVCPLTSEFRNPYIDNINKDKNWFFCI